MLARAVVNMPDWPRGSDRDVDEEDEAILGALRAHHIVPLVKRSETPSPAIPEPPDLSLVETSEVAEPAPEPPKRPRKGS
jgi:hypothetical protein